MPTFEVTSPEGKKYQVTGPKGATSAQVEGFISKNFPAKMNPPSMGLAERFEFGLEDPFYAPGQTFEMATGQSDGPATQAVRQRESEFRSRVGGGFDPVRSAGQALNPMNLMAGGGAAATMRPALAGAVGGAVGAALEPVPSGDPAEKVANVLGGGVGGAALGTVGSAIANYPKVRVPFPRSSARQAATQALDKAGIPYTAGQASGNKSLIAAEAHLGELPGAGNATERANQQSAEGFNRWALAQTGTQGDTADQATIYRMWKGLGARYQQLTSTTQVQLDRTDLARVGAALRNYDKDTPPAMRIERIRDSVADIVDLSIKNGGLVDGKTYQGWRSSFEQKARNASTPAEKFAYRELARTLDDAVERTMAQTGSPNVGKFRELRKHYRNAIAIGDSIGVGARANDINPNKLRNALIEQDQRGYQSGRGDMAETTHAADLILAPLPNSGTPIRSATTAPIRSIIGGLGGRILHSDPVQHWLRAQGPRPNVGSLPALPPVLSPGAGSALAQPDDLGPYE